jgi:sugar phosphate isomerase/epimerase
MLSIGSNINELRVDGSLKSLKQDLDAFLEFGLTSAEIPIHGLDAVRNGRCDKKRTLAIKTILSDYPFRYSTHAPNPLNLMDRHDPNLHRDVLFASLECTAGIGASCMVYHPGRYLAEEEFAIYGPVIVTPRERITHLDYEAQILRIAADSFPDVIIAMENARPYLYHSPYCYAEIPADLKQQIQRIDRDNVRMALDFGHLHLAAHFYGLNELDVVNDVAPFIAHCHVHDNFGCSVYHTEKIQTHQIPFGKGDSHMPVGWGNIPFQTLFAPFIRDYKGLLICELRGRYFENTGESAENLAQILHGIGVFNDQWIKKQALVENRWG